MGNYSVKKLGKAVSILSLTAVLASMPVSATSYAIATSSSAEACAGSYEYSVWREVSAELSCEFGPISGTIRYEDAADGEHLLIAEANESDDPARGECRSSYAAAWLDGDMVAYDSYNW